MVITLCEAVIDFQLHKINYKTPLLKCSLCDEALPSITHKYLFWGESTFLDIQPLSAASAMYSTVP